jgi:hypothetical protein
MGFGLVIGFINHSKIVTTINYNTVTNFHSTSTPRHSSQSDLLFPSVLLVPIRTLVRVHLPRLLNWTTTVTAFTSSHLETETLLVWNWTIWNQSQSQSYVRPAVQSASPSWNKPPIWDLRPDLYYCQTVAGLLIWGALPEERTGLSFARLTQQ